MSTLLCLLQWVDLFAHYFTHLFCSFAVWLIFNHLRIAYCIRISLAHQDMAFNIHNIPILAVKPHMGTDSHHDVWKCCAKVYAQIAKKEQLDFWIWNMVRVLENQMIRGACLACIQDRRTYICKDWKKWISRSHRQFHCSSTTEHVKIDLRIDRNY